MLLALQTCGQLPLAPCVCCDTHIVGAVGAVGVPVLELHHRGEPGAVLQVQSWLIIPQQGPPASVSGWHWEILPVYPGGSGTVLG